MAWQSYKRSSLGAFTRSALGARNKLTQGGDWVFVNSNGNLLLVEANTTTVVDSVTGSGSSGHDVAWDSDGVVFSRRGSTNAWYLYDATSSGAKLAAFGTQQSQLTFPQSGAGYDFDITLQANGVTLAEGDSVGALHEGSNVAGTYLTQWSGLSSTLLDSVGPLTYGGAVASLQGVCYDGQDVQVADRNPRGLGGSGSLAVYQGVISSTVLDDAAASDGSGGDPFGVTFNGTGTLWLGQDEVVYELDAVLGSVTNTTDVSGLGASTIRGIEWSNYTERTSKT